MLRTPPDPRRGPPSGKSPTRKAFLRAVAAAACLGVALLSPAPAPACTRVVYLGANGQVITARSMDWRRDTGTNLWIFPRGMARDGAAGRDALRWTSRYGSVVASGYDVATTDGVNEAGLAANLLWLAESEYPRRDPARPALSLAAWAQYALDNFATVAEAVAALREEAFTVVTDDVPGEQRLAALHLALSDATGDSAIFEYLGGRLVIHHGRDFQVMTNSPPYDQQLALDAYWRQIGGTVMLPGTNRAADRFVRASFYIGAIPKVEGADLAVASVFSVIRNVSVPLGLTTPDEPNIASTRWRSLVDHKRRLYFFESALTPNVFWVDLKEIDFSAETGRTRKLDLGPDQDHTFSGDATASFEDAAPFPFLAVPDRPR